VLAAGQRLRRGTEFTVAVRKGRRAGRGAVVVHLDLTETASSPPKTEQHQASPAEPAHAVAEQRFAPARAGFVVSRAVGSAVVRNRVRRRLRHLVRDRLPGLPPGSTLVVRALPGAAEVPYARLGADLDAAIAAARRPRGARRQR
jgi:ribonuclease P protein component